MYTKMNAVVNKYHANYKAFMSWMEALRELCIMLGYHNACWEKAFGPNDIRGDGMLRAALFVLPKRIVHLPIILT